MGDADHPGEGHRKRLRDRLVRNGMEALADHEVLEALLHLTIPRRDTKARAKQLIADFGSLSALLSAEPATLASKGGLTERQVGALKIVQAAAVRLLQDGIRQTDILSSWQALIDYLHANMAHRRTECVRLLFLNSRNMVIADEMMWEGSVDESAVYIREIIRRALEHQASAIIVVHNHPSGDPTPSQQDIRLTRDLAEAAKHMRITLHDHVIIAGSGHSSLRSLGLF